MSENALQFLAVLLDAQMNGVVEIYQGGKRCKYCLYPFEDKATGHYTDCIYHMALCWQSRVVIESKSREVPAGLLSVVEQAQ